LLRTTQVQNQTNFSSFSSTPYIAPPACTLSYILVTSSLCSSLYPLVCTWTVNAFLIIPSGCEVDITFKLSLLLQHLFFYRYECVSNDVYRNWAMTFIVMKKSRLLPCACVKNGLTDLLVLKHFNSLITYYSLHTRYYVNGTTTSLIPRPHPPISINIMNPVIFFLPFTCHNDLSQFIFQSFFN